MSLFPRTIGQQREIRPTFATKQSKLGENQTTVYRKALFPRWEITLGWTLLAKADADLIDAHVLANAGSALPWEWADWTPFNWLSVRIGTGDGVATVFDVPSFGTQAGFQLYYDAGNVLAGTLQAGAGADGRDRILYSAAPASGVILWWNFTGQRIFRVTFANDDQPMTRQLETGYYAFATNLESEKPTP